MLIYLVTNKINGSVYVGQTTLTLEQRKSYHERESLCEHRSTVKFHNALLKYGFENFVWEALCECDSQEELDYYEQLYIAQYNACDRIKGYNLKLGGRSGGLMTEEAKANLGESTRRKWANPECAKRMREGLRKGTETQKRKAAMNFIEHVCPVCKTVFRTKKHDSHTYCSLRCANIALKHTLKAKSQRAAEVAHEALLMRQHKALPLICDWCVKHRNLIENAKFNDLKFLKDLALFVGVKDTRSLGKLLNLRYKKEIVWKLKDIIKYMPTNMETC